VARTFLTVARLTRGDFASFIDLFPEDHRFRSRIAATKRPGVFSFDV
jgi:hypothetical protein